MSEMSVKELVDDVYEITWRRLETEHRTLQYRTHFFDFDDDDPTLVDTCLPDFSDALFAGIEEIGTVPERLIITHNHPDHAGSIDDVVARYDPELWAPETEDIRDADRTDISTEPDRRYGHEDYIGRFVAIHLPGHTAGSSALVDEDAGVAVCGDAVSGSDRRGLPKGHLIHPPQATNPTPEMDVQAEENLERLLDYDFDVALVHHGSSVFEDAREKLDTYVNYAPKPPFDNL